MIKKYKEGIMYLIFGVLTTILNYFTFYVLHVTLGTEYDVLSNILAFLDAVVFAYITNKLYVFESKSWKFDTVLHEITAFMGARLITFAIEETGIAISSYVLHLERYQVYGLDGILISKMVLNVIVIILNYIFSKFIVFKTSRKNETKD